MDSTYFFDTFDIDLACESCCEIPPTLYTTSTGIFICNNCGSVVSKPPPGRTEDNSNAGNIPPSNSLAGDTLYGNDQNLPDLEAPSEQIGENATHTLSSQQFHCAGSSNELHEGNIVNNVQQQTTLLPSPNGLSENWISGMNMPLAPEMDIPPNQQSQSNELRTQQSISGWSSNFLFNSHLIPALLQDAQQRSCQRNVLHNVQVLGNSHAVEVKIAEIHTLMGFSSDIKCLALEIAQSVPDSYNFRHVMFPVAMGACLFLSCKALRRHLTPFKDFTNVLGCRGSTFYRIIRSIERAVSQTYNLPQDEFLTALGRLLWPKCEDEEQNPSDERQAHYLCELCCQRLLLDEPSTRICKELVTKLISDQFYGGFRWYTKAAVSVLIAADLMGNRKTRFDVVAAAGIAYQTFDHLGKNLYRYRVRLFEPSWLSAGADMTRWPAW